MHTVPLTQATLALRCVSGPSLNLLIATNAIAGVIFCITRAETLTRKDSVVFGRRARVTYTQNAVGNIVFHVLPLVWVWPNLDPKDMMLCLTLAVLYIATADVQKIYPSDTSLLPYALMYMVTFAIVCRIAQRRPIRTTSSS